MKPFRLTILGSNAAFPAHGRLTSSMCVQFNNDYYIIDACEAVQLRIQEYKIPIQKIKAILISHLHGDHIFGLPGLINSFSMHNRTKELLLIGPRGIKEYVETVMRISQAHLFYDLNIIEIDPSNRETIISNQSLNVLTFPLNHRIETCGYRFNELVPEYNIRKNVIEELQLSINEIKSIKKGQHIVRGGETIDNTTLVYKKEKPRSFAYCSDTSYDESIVKDIQDVQLLYHETTYLKDLEDKAKERGHSTAEQAAKMAKLARAKTLITGHYSPRYKYVDEFIQEAKTVFENTLKGYDGFIFDLIPST